MDIPIICMTHNGIRPKVARYVGCVTEHATSVALLSHYGLSNGVVAFWLSVVVHAVIFAKVCSKGTDAERAISVEIPWIVDFCDGCIKHRGVGVVGVPKIMPKHTNSYHGVICFLDRCGNSEVRRGVLVE